MKKTNSEGYGIRTTVYGLRYTDYGKGFTLIELLIALSLVGMIILAIVAVDVGSRGFLKSTDQESKLQNTVNFALGSIAKDISRSYRGSKKNPAIKNPSSYRMEIRLRKGADDTTLSDDTWTAYEFSGNTINELGCSAISPDGANCNGSWGSPIPLANNIVNCAFSLSADNLAGISITARADASQDKSQDNPEVISETSVYPPGSIR